MILRANTPEDPTECDVLVLVPDDIHVCFDEEFDLNGQIIGDYDDYVWIEGFGETSYDLDESVSVHGTTVFTLVAWYQSEENIIINGDFEDGNSGFTTDYVVGSFSCFGLGYLDCEGTYDVIDNPNDGHANFASCSDAEGGGNMMVVNGAASLQEIWCQEVCVNEGTEYNFSAWGASVNPSSPAELQFSIDGNLIGDLFSLSSDLCAWEEFETFWTASASTTVEICVTNQNTASGGNDFALDNIAFYQTCMDQASFTVTVSDFETDLIVPEDLNCIQDLSDGIAYVDPPAQYDFELLYDDEIILEDSNDEFYFEIDMAGEYILLITDEYGCQIETDFEIEEDLEEPDLELEVSNMIDCENDFATIIADSDTRSVIFNWYDENFDFILEDDELDVNQAGLYYVVAIDPDNGCESIDSITVEQDNDIPELELYASGNLNCQNSIIQLTAEHSGSTIEWYDSMNNLILSNNDSILIDSIGTYYVIILDENTCSNSDSIQVSYEQNLFQYDIEYIPEINCLLPASTIDITIDTSLFTISWQDSNVNAINASQFQIDNPGIYTYSIIDSLGCQEIDSIVISENTDIPNYEIEADSLSCNNTEASVQLLSSGAELSIQWFIGSDTLTDDIISVSQSGIYSYTVTATNGCEESGNVEIIATEVIPVITIINEDISCSNPQAEIYFDASTEAAEVYWQFPDNTLVYSDTIYVEEAGSYTLNFTDENNCAFTQSTEIQIDTLSPILELPEAIELNCIDSVYTGTIVTDILEPEIDFSGDWINSNTLDYILSDAGQYDVELTAQNGCSVQSSITVTLDTIRPSISLQDSFYINCMNESIDISPTISSEYDHLIWEFGSQSSSDTILTINQEMPIGLTVFSENGCSSQAETFVSADFTLPEFEIQTDTLSCFNTDVEVLFLSEDDDLKWLSTAVDMDTIEINSIILNEAGLYSVTAISQNGCTQSKNFEIPIDTTTINFTIEADSLDCSTISTQIKLMSTEDIPSLMLSTPQGLNFDNLDQYFSEEGIYNVTVQNSNGCISERSIEIIKNTEPPVLLDVFYEDLICAPAIKLLDLDIEGGTPPYDIILDGENIEQEEFPVEVYGEGAHSISITDNKSCETNAEIIIDPVDMLEVTPINTVELLVGEDFQLELSINKDESEIADIEWFPEIGLSCYDCFSPRITGTEDIEYNVTVTDYYGCTDSINVRVRFSRLIRYYIPNVIALGQSNNNRFTVFADQDDIQSILSMRIYDRWGNLVFENENFEPANTDEAWDGYIKNKEAEPGVYVYTAELLLADGSIELVAGDITLIR